MGPLEMAGSHLQSSCRDAELSDWHSERSDLESWFWTFVVQLPRPFGVKLGVTLVIEGELDVCLRFFGCLRWSDAPPNARQKANVIDVGTRLFACPCVPLRAPACACVPLRAPACARAKQAGLEGLDSRYWPPDQINEGRVSPIERSRWRNSKAKNEITPFKNCRK